MTIPIRIQRKRTKGWRMPENTVYVGRGSKWGNPFVLNDRSGLAREPAIHRPDKSWEYEGRISAAGTRHDYFHSDGKVTPVTVRYMTLDEIVLCYRAYVTGGEWPCDWKRHSQVEEIREALAGKNLSCWCPLDKPCHADVLLELANLWNSGAPMTSKPQYTFHKGIPIPVTPRNEPKQGEGA